MSRDSFRNILITIFTANFDDISELHIFSECHNLALVLNGFLALTMLRYVRLFIWVHEKSYLIYKS